MNKYHRWLLDEIELWRTEGIINPDQAQQLIVRYDDQLATAWGKIVFSAIGAIVFGLGIILFFAYNWEVMGRVTKLGLVFLSVVLAHGAGYQLSAPQSTHQKLGESMHLLGTMLFGAGIWLIAQIYHIDEHYPNGILLWAMGALLLAWVIPSLAHTMLAMALLILWHCFEVFDFNHANHWVIWLIAFGILPLAWMHRSRVVLFCALTLFISSYAISAISIDLSGGAVITILFTIACSYILFSRIVSGSHFPESASVFRLVGVSVYAVLLFMLTIGDIQRYVFTHITDIGALQWFYWLLPVGVAAGGVLLILLRYSDAISETIDRIETGIVLTALVTVVFLAFTATPLDQISRVLFNLLFLTHGLVLIWRGTQYVRWQSVTLGSVMLAAFTVARFLDLFQSLLMRSLAFLVLGAALFAIGIYYSNQKQRHGELKGGQQHA